MCDYLNNKCRRKYFRWSELKNFNIKKNYKFVHYSSNNKNTKFKKLVINFQLEYIPIFITGVSKLEMKRQP